MALTNDGPKMVDPSGRPVMRIRKVDGDGIANAWQYAMQDTTPALSTTATLVACSSTGGLGQTSPTANVVTLLGFIRVNLESIVTAVSCTVTVTADAAGDQIVWTSGAITLATGAATSSDGGFTVQLAEEGLPMFTNVTAFNVWLTLNAGTATVTRVHCFWRQG